MASRFAGVILGLTVVALACGGKSSSVDAGLSSDAGAGDAGSIDAGQDAGLPDGGVDPYSDIAQGPTSVFSQFFGQSDSVTFGMTAAADHDGGFVNPVVYQTPTYSQMDADHIWPDERTFYGHIFGASAVDGGASIEMTAHAAVDSYGVIDVGGTCGENAKCQDQTHGPGVVGGYLFQIDDSRGLDSVLYSVVYLGGRDAGTVTVDGIATDATGDVYVVGALQGDQGFGLLNVSSTVRTPYVARFSGKLVPRWVEDVGTAGALSELDSVVVGANGLVVVGGRGAADGGRPVVAALDGDGGLLWASDLKDAAGRVVGLGWSGDEWVAAVAADAPCDPAESPCSPAPSGWVVAGDSSATVRWELPITGRPTAIAANAAQTIVGIDAHDTVLLGTGRVRLPSDVPSIVAVALQPDGGILWKDSVSAESSARFALTSVALGDEGTVMLSGETESPVAFEWDNPVVGTPQAAFFSVLGYPDGGP